MAGTVDSSRIHTVNWHKGCISLLDYEKIFLCIIKCMCRHFISSLTTYSKYSMLRVCVCPAGELKQEEYWADVQKKIAPWNLNAHEVEPHFVTKQRVTRLGKATTALLVVASLIDKPTNLGGKSNFPSHIILRCQVFALIIFGVIIFFIISHCHI